MGIILSKFKKHKIRRALIEKLENEHGVSNKKRGRLGMVLSSRRKAKRKGKTKLTNPQS